jgi:hypothetical protein
MRARWVVSFATTRFTIGYSRLGDKEAQSILLQPVAKDKPPPTNDAHLDLTVEDVDDKGSHREHVNYSEGMAEVYRVAAKSGCGRPEYPCESSAQAASLMLKRIPARGADERVHGASGWSRIATQVGAPP